MSEYDDTNTGALFINDKGGNEKRPDRRGTINIEGVEYTLSGWIRTPKKGGDKFLSLKAERKEKQSSTTQRQSTPGKQTPDSGDEEPCPF